MATLVVSPAMMRLTVAPKVGRAAVPQVGAGEAAQLTQPIPGSRKVPDAGGETGSLPAEAASASRGLRAEAASAHDEAARAAALAEHARLAALVSRCLQGDAQAWELLVRSQQRRVYGLCYRFTGSPTEAEDLTQDVFLKVYRNLRSFDPVKASFGVWLSALTRNLLVDHYRRSRLERASESLDEPSTADEDGPTRAERLPDGAPGQERHIAGVELRAKVQAALARISPELREAVILRDLEDLDYREIADVLCIPQGTVKSRISRGRAELARLLKDLEGQVM